MSCIKQIITFLFVAAILLNFGCNKDALQPDTNLLPDILTLDAVNVGSGSAESGGKIRSSGSTAIRAKGICWSLEENPSADSINKTNEGPGQDNFASKAKGLLANSRYFLRAWAENDAGIAYGNQVSFSTSGIDSLICSRVIHEGNITAGFSAEGSSTRIPYLGNIEGNYPEVRFNSGGISGLTAILEAGFFSADSGHITIKFSGIPAKAGTAYFLLKIGGKSCTLYRQVGIADREGNSYETISIGTQVWMKQNLNTAFYRNGDSIPYLASDTAWSNANSGAFCMQTETPDAEFFFGKLYNWHALADPRGLCPEGFHIPADEEWLQMETFLGGKGGAGGKMKTKGIQEEGSGLWFSPNSGASNSSGFSGIPGGYRKPEGVLFSLGQYGYWWTSSAVDEANAWYRSLSFLNPASNRNFSSKISGKSIRCIRD